MGRFCAAWIDWQPLCQPAPLWQLDADHHHCHHHYEDDVIDEYDTEEGGKDDDVDDDENGVYLKAVNINLRANLQKIKSVNLKYL